MIKFYVKYLIIIPLSFTEFFTGCNDNNPVSSKIKVDPDLIGVWYSLDTIKYVQHEPEISVNGIRFLQNGAADFVGVESETGNLAILGAYDSLLQASDGIIALRRKITYFYNYDTLHYKISSNVLEYTSNRQEYPRVGRYFRSEIGKNVLAPVISNFKIKIDNIGIENDKISNNVSAYVSNFGTEFWIGAKFGDNWFLSLRAKQSLSTGLFTFNNNYSYYNSITLKHNLTDESGELYSTDTTFTGALEITDFNNADGIIKGSITAQLKFMGVYTRNESFSKTSLYNKIMRDSVSIKIEGNFILPVY